MIERLSSIRGVALIESDDKPLALVLSGGGIRAMVFHFGVLRFLAVQGQLERVNYISSVSGGTLAIGLLLKETDLIWPTSQQFLEHSLPSIRAKLCSRSLMKDMLRQLMRPRNFRFLFSRANLLGGALRDEWGITDQLAETPKSPEWSLNGTTAETGKRFRFKRENFGDYILGYASSEEFSLADAMAVSAAFPGGIGPLVIGTSEYSWMKRDWGEPLEAAKPASPPYPRLHLYDGGIYDNLGLEPYFDAGRGKVKEGLPSNLQLFVSDAGAPLQQGFSISRFNPWRMKRVVDIMSDQSRALRVRAFMNFVKSHDKVGAYFYIGDTVTGSNSCPSANYASSFPTTLRRLKDEEFDKLMDHGFEVAKKVLSQSAPMEVKPA